MTQCSIRLATRGSVRLCVENEDTVTLYHCLDNAAAGTIQFSGRPLYQERGVLFSMEFAPALEHIISVYPVRIATACSLVCLLYD